MNDESKIELDQALLERVTGVAYYNERQVQHAGHLAACLGQSILRSPGTLTAAGCWEGYLGR